MKTKLFLGCLLVLSVFVLSYCDNNNHNSGSDNGMNFAPSAMNASIILNGTDVSGQILNNPGQNDRLKLQVQFNDPQGNQTIRNPVAHWTHHSGMMMHHMGDYNLWDDGTHGDDVAGDGWYCYENDMFDMMNMMGEQWGNNQGTHDYEFYCHDEDGNESNHVTAHIDIQ